MQHLPRKDERLNLTLEGPSGFEPGTPGFGIQRLNLRPLLHKCSQLLQEFLGTPETPGVLENISFSPGKLLEI